MLIFLFEEYTAYIPVMRRLSLVLVLQEALWIIQLLCECSCYQLTSCHDASTLTAEIHDCKMYTHCRGNFELP